ncbi:MAG: 5-methyltetrahydrofolate--homocysteine methyltransferase, partial [Prevotella sp.]|nr:5-methyltetrahydrofolate--homocysteine methyltransferase [Prevotella sp.]
KLRNEAETLLKEMEGQHHTFALFDILEANSDGDDIIMGDVRIPMLRQQQPQQDGTCLCLADFVRPLSSGIKDRVGAFATTVDGSMEHEHKGDHYMQMMTQTIADRLAEATAEKMHEEVRKIYWGYSPDEHLTMEQIHMEKFQGIRPAVGYPSLPDTSVNFILSDMIGMKQIGISLTESGMMRPHASVSGLMLAHPKARYFDLGTIGEDQLRDYAMRRGLPIELMRKYIK